MILLVLYYKMARPFISMDTTANLERRHGRSCLRLRDLQNSFSGTGQNKRVPGELSTVNYYAGFG